jgi:glycosyltransferase involved in cell wall biosynthesis
MGARLVVLCDTVGEVGGTERYYERVLPALARSNDVLVLARNVERPDLFGVPARAIDWSPEDRPPNEIAAAMVADEIDAFAPDVVLAGNVFDAAVLRAARRAPRFAVRIHDHRSFCPNGDRRFPQMPGICHSPMGAACAVNSLLRGCVSGPRAATLDRLRAREAVRDAISMADVVLVSSGYMAQTCTTNGIDQQRVAITPPPLPNDAFADAVSAPPLLPRLLFAGRIVPQKGLESLLRALGAIPEKQRPALDVAGAGDLANAQALAAQLGVVFDYHGFRDAAQLRDLIDACSAVAVPSLWPEPFGLIGIEAQARGRPAIAYDVGGIGEWLGQAGAVVRVGDERALARAIQSVCSPAAWPAFARAAFAHSAAFRLNAHLDLLLRALLRDSREESISCAS